MRANKSWFWAIVVAATLTSAATAADQMPWQPSLEAAQQIAARTNRLVLVHFWSSSCKPCLRMDSEVFSKPEVARALEPNFVMVKLNVDESPGTAQLYGVSSIPTDVITLPNGRLVWQVQSPPAANQYIAQMNQAAAGHRALMQGPPAQAVAATPPAGAPPVGPPTAPAAMTPPSAPPVAQGNDRYAEYFAQSPAAGQPAGPAHYPGAAMPQAPAATAPPVAGNMPAPVGAVQPAVGGYGAQAAAYRPNMPPTPQLPPGAPPLALDGYCPTTLVERQQWALGDVRFGAIHRGRTYLFLGPGEVQKFMADPEKYAPVLSGNDPVLAMDSQQLVPGRREYGVYSDNRVYLFADEASRQRFEQNPKRYAAESLQAATPPTTAVR
jgi:protein disulfide-isomerase